MLTNEKQNAHNSIKINATMAQISRAAKAHPRTSERICQRKHNWVVAMSYFCLTRTHANTHRHYDNNTTPPYFTTSLPVKNS